MHEDPIGNYLNKIFFKDKNASSDLYDGFILRKKKYTLKPEINPSLKTICLPISLVLSSY